MTRSPDHPIRFCYSDFVSSHNPVYFTIIGLVAGTLTTLSFVPQLMKTIRTRRTQDMSGVWLTCYICGLTLWLIYGLLLPSMPIILANSVSLLLTLPILVIKIAHRNPPQLPVVRSSTTE